MAEELRPRAQIPVDVECFLFKYFPNRWWHRFVPRQFRRYVRWNGTEQLIWDEAPNYVPFVFRRLGRTINVSEIDAALGAYDRWCELKAQLLPGDRIWPFLINRHTMAMRGGLIVIRHGRYLAGIVLIVS